MQVSRIVALIAGALVASQSSAALLGDTVSLNAYHAFSAPVTGSCLTLSATRAIGAGSELTLADTVIANCSGAFGVDIVGNTGVLTLFALQGFAVGAGNYEFGTIEITGFDDLISSFSFVANNNLFRTDDPYSFGSIVPTAVTSFTGSSIRIDFSAPVNQFVIADGGTMTFQIGAATVPEPGTLGLLGLSALGLAAVRRRRPA